MLFFVFRIVMCSVVGLAAPRLARLLADALDLKLDEGDLVGGLLTVGLRRAAAGVDSNVVLVTAEITVVANLGEGYGALVAEAVGVGVELLQGLGAGRRGVDAQVRDLLVRRPVSALVGDGEAVVLAARLTRADNASDLVVAALLAVDRDVEGAFVSSVAIVPAVLGALGLLVGALHVADLGRVGVVAIIGLGLGLTLLHVALVTVGDGLASRGLPDDLGALVRLFVVVTTSDGTSGEKAEDSDGRELHFEEGLGFLRRRSCLK